jgi:phage-related baseplate assembly protein
MSTPTFAEKDAAVVLSEALAAYKAATVSASSPSGVSLAPADPRRLHLQALLALLTQIRALIDHAGKQNLLRYVDDEHIDAFAEILGETRIAAAPSTCTQRFVGAAAGILTIPAGKRVTDGTSIWRVPTAAVSAEGSSYVDVAVECITNGSATNGVAIGQIDALVDNIPGIASTTNVTATISGREIETLEAFRARLRDVPESSSTCGPRLAYEAMARAASASVEDVKALGPDDAPYMAGTDPQPGEVHVLITEVDADTPSAGLITAVDEYCTAETRRPLGDNVIVKAPQYVTFDVDVTWYIAREREDFVTEITEAVEAAFEEYKAWQRKIGRNINPNKLVTLMMNAGAYRVTVQYPSYLALERDQCSRLNPYPEFVFGGVQDE